MTEGEEYITGLLVSGDRLQMDEYIRCTNKYHHITDSEKA